MKKTVFAIGEILWDLLPGAMLLGGAPFNFIHRIHSLGDRGIMMSRLGKDDLGKQAFGRIESLGLDTSYIQWDDTYPTGTVEVTVDSDGNPDFYIVPDVAYDYLVPPDDLTSVASVTDCVCYGTLAQRCDRSRETIHLLLEHFCDSLKFLDINLRKNCFTTGSVRRSLEAADVLKLNDDEVIRLTDKLDMKSRTIPDFCEEAADRWSLMYCLVTLGGDGVFAFSFESGPMYIPGYRVKVSDTIGAGDGFSAGFVHRIVRGDSLRVAGELGNILGALVASKQGGTAPVTKTEIERLAQDKTMERSVRRELERFIV